MDSDNSSSSSLSDSLAQNCVQCRTGFMVMNSPTFLCCGQNLCREANCFPIKMLNSRKEEEGRSPHICEDERERIFHMKSFSNRREEFSVVWVCRTAAEWGHTVWPLRSEIISIITFSDVT